MSNNTRSTSTSTPAATLDTTSITEDCRDWTEAEDEELETAFQANKTNTGDGSYWQRITDAFNHAMALSVFLYEPRTRDSVRMRIGKEKNWSPAATETSNTTSNTKFTRSNNNRRVWTEKEEEELKTAYQANEAKPFDGSYWRRIINAFNDAMAKLVPGYEPRTQNSIRGKLGSQNWYNDKK